MTQSRAWSPLRFELPRPFARGLRAAFGAASLALVLSSACGDDPAPAPALVPDAGPACQRGTLNCACIGGSSCQDALLCIAGRCSLTERGPSENLPPPRRPPPELDLPEPDAGGEPPVLDAGAADASAPDDGAGAETDAGGDAG